MAMRSLALLLLACLPFTACTSVKGPGWSYASLGADTEGINVSAAGFSAVKINQSAALGQVTDTIKGMWTNYLMAEGLKYLAGKYYDQEGTVISSAETVKLEELKNAKSAADASAALETLKANHAAEAAAAVITQ